MKKNYLIDRLKNLICVCLVKWVYNFKSGCDIKCRKRKLAKRRTFTLEQERIIARVCSSLDVHTLTQDHRQYSSNLSILENAVNNLGSSNSTCSLHIFSSSFNVLYTIVRSVPEKEFYRRFGNSDLEAILYLILRFPNHLEV